MSTFATVVFAQVLERVRDERLRQLTERGARRTLARGAARMPQAVRSRRLARDDGGEVAPASRATARTMPLWRLLAHFSAPSVSEALGSPGHPHAVPQLQSPVEGSDSQ